MNIRLTWKLPEVSQRQRPVSGVRIEFRVSDDLPWTEQDTVNGEELLFEDMGPGDYSFRATVIDDRGNEGIPATTTASIEFDPPGAVENLTATIE